MNFDVYQTFTDEIKRLATAFWLEYAMASFEQRSVNQLRQFLFYMLERAEKPISRCQSKLLYNKRKGVPFKNADYVAKVATLDESTEEVLYHPLWQLLNKGEFSRQELGRLIKQLPTSIQDLLPVVGGKAEFSDEFRIGNYHDINGLSAGLICYKWQLSRGSSSFKLSVLEKECFKLFLRMFSFDYKRYQFTYELFEQLSKHFPTNITRSQFRHITGKGFPSYFGQVKNRFDLAQCLKLYRKLAGNLQSCDQPSLSMLEMKDYLSFAEHEDIKQLLIDLERSKGICPEERDTALGKLRLSYYFSNQRVVTPPLINFFNEKELFINRQNHTNTD